MKKRKMRCICFAASMLFLGNMMLHPVYAQDSVEEKMKNISRGLPVNVNRVTDYEGPKEGIYYIVNKSSNRFLVDTVTVPSNPEQWLITKDKTEDDFHFYNMRVDCSSGYLNGKQIPTEPWNYFTAMTDGDKGKICFHYRNGGSYTIRFNPEMDLYMLREGYVPSGQKFASTSWKFYTSSDVTDKDEWYIYKVNYAFGDVDRNGYVNAADARMIQQYINKSRTLTEVEKYLADINRDGTIDAKDIAKINQSSYK